QIRRGITPDNFISPNALTSLEKSHLKQAFAVVGQLQEVLAQRYSDHL
ncbi:MAG: hypothetical protein K9J42_16055, partial [Sulfuritalea sp.]|nr:hypothetical protein [Sulfuritalea sp.]